MIERVRNLATVLFLLIGPTLVLLTGCATAPAGSSTDCRSDLPRAFEAFSVFPDSTALQAGLEAAWEAGTERAVGHVWYDSTGVLGSATVHIDTESRELRERLEEAIEQGVLTEFRPRTSVYLFLGDRDGPSVRRVNGFRRCEPILVNRDEIGVSLRDRFRKLGVRGQFQINVAAPSREATGEGGGQA